MPLHLLILPLKHKLSCDLGGGRTVGFRFKQCILKAWPTSENYRDLISNSFGFLSIKWGRADNTWEKDYLMFICMS